MGVGQCFGVGMLRRLLKFLHTVGAIGLMGGMACLLVLLSFASTPTSLPGYALMRGAMSGIALYIFLPSLALTLVAGLLAMAMNRGYHNAGWAWAKLATGILVFEWGFTAVLGGMQQEADLSLRALAGEVNSAELAAALDAERNSLWVLLAIGAINIILAIWRPRLVGLRD